MLTRLLAQGARGAHRARRRRLADGLHDVEQRGGRDPAGARERHAARRRGARSGGPRQDDFEAFFASLGEDDAPPPARRRRARACSTREIDFLREALREAFPDPSAAGVPRRRRLGRAPADGTSSSWRRRMTCSQRLDGAAAELPHSSGRSARSCCWPSHPTRARSRCAGPRRAPRRVTRAPQWPAGALPLARCTRCSTGPSTGR